jgi:hypothetical protein
MAAIGSDVAFLVVVACSAVGVIAAIVLLIRSGRSVPFPELRPTRGGSRR